MIIHEMEQRTAEWYAVRAGKLTASEAQTIATNGKGLETLVYATLAEKYSNGKQEHYMSLDMLRGVELEEQARQTYELLHAPVREVGFIELNEYAGCSPDGLVGDKGGIEIKCPNNEKFFRMMVNGAKEIDKKYLWQCQMSLFVSGMDWWDLCFFNPNFDESLLVFRQEIDKEMHEKIHLGLAQGTMMIKNIEEKLCKK